MRFADFRRVKSNPYQKRNCLNYISISKKNVHHAVHSITKAMADGLFSFDLSLLSSENLINIQISDIKPFFFIRVELLHSFKLKERGN